MLQLPRQHAGPSPRRSLPFLLTGALLPGLLPECPAEGMVQRDEGWCMGRERPVLPDHQPNLHLGQGAQPTLTGFPREQNPAFWCRRGQNPWGRRGRDTAGQEQLGTQAPR